MTRNLLVTSSTKRLNKKISVVMQYIRSFRNCLCQCTQKWRKGKFSIRVRRLEQESELLRHTPLCHHCALRTLVAELSIYISETWKHRVWDIRSTATQRAECDKPNVNIRSTPWWQRTTCGSVVTATNHQDDDPTILDEQGWPRKPSSQRW